MGQRAKEEGQRSAPQRNGLRIPQGRDYTDDTD